MGVFDELLPARPPQLADRAVAVWSAPITLPTYLPDAPSPYPAFLNRRVYQGSSGRVFPLPLIDRIDPTRRDHAWTGLHLENEYLRVVVLPELGGRIQYAIDRRNGYPMFYANPVIKPALVGLAGPWIAGGVEFNWPQHHRPGTFLPLAWSIDEATGTAWCSEHDPFTRMKGMHGVRLRPASTALELHVRLYNRSELPATFLWWSNAAAEVNEEYQSFFPADVTMVADHAKRAVVSFPSAQTSYYGVDYPARAKAGATQTGTSAVAADRLDWPCNIPVPTSYMCLGSAGDFFGGYDHRAGAGFVHVADHRVVVGKKQWTWGNSDFGRAWNRNLTDGDATYIELMAGAFTENQPDFSHLAPGETKTFTQTWFPLRGTGPVVEANLDAAIGIGTGDGSTMIRIEATHDLGTVRVEAQDEAGALVPAEDVRLSPMATAQVRVQAESVAAVRLLSADGRVLLSWPTPSRVTEELRAALEPPDPSAIGSVEELYLTGRHLAQYRHATRSPEPFWQQAIARDPGHAASRVALARQRYQQADFASAEEHLRLAIGRLTMLNPNPESGEAHYLLGLTLIRLGRRAEAYDAFAKASWLEAWTAAATLQLAFLDAQTHRDSEALTHVETVMRSRREDLQARDLAAVLLRRLGRTAEADRLAEETLHLDPLDAWAMHLAGRSSARQDEADPQLVIDVALDEAASGEWGAAVGLCERARVADPARPSGQTACGILADYHAARILDLAGDPAGAATARERARAGDRTGNFASRLDDVAALEAALAIDPDDPTATALLGQWYYAHGREQDAITLWRHSAATGPNDPVLWRNLGMAAYNIERDPQAALDAYGRASALAPDDAQLLYEADQLRRRCGATAHERLVLVAARLDLVGHRDDLSVEYAQLLVTSGRPYEAIELLAGRAFQPWEGGEGKVLRAWERAQVAAAALAMDDGDPLAAAAHVRAAMAPPGSLGEARHPLSPTSGLHLALGDCQAASGDLEAARASWTSALRQAAESTGVSESTWYAGLAAQRLGDDARAADIAAAVAARAQGLAVTPARVDYFATSLPELLLFDDDPQAEADRSVQLLDSQRAYLARDLSGARWLLGRILASDPSHETALDLLRLIDRERSPR